MDTRNVTVTLDKAREWYNSGNATLREVALQAFTEDELNVSYVNIKKMEDVVDVLGITIMDVMGIVKSLPSKHLKAVYRTDLICKALNGGWEPSLVEGNVYYPRVEFYPHDKVSSNRKKDITDYFIYEGKKYALVGGDCYYWSVGLGDFSGGDSSCNAGLLGCKSREIAFHMSKYFAKEIFLACYEEKLGDKVKWV